MASGVGTPRRMVGMEARFHAVAGEARGMSLTVPSDTFAPATLVFPL